jgi:PilZ domain
MTVRQRSSQRVVLAIPVRISGKTDDGRSIDEMTKTLVVSPGGACVTLNAPVGEGQKLSLVNKHTGIEIPCRVANIRNSKKNPTWEVGIAFDESAPGYWGLTFPPIASPLANPATSA